jgi:uncharacterized membrane protein HdeD (DUF308 family)
MSAETGATLAFYVGLLALIVGVIRIARARLERRRPDPFGMTIAAAGALVLVAAMLLYLSGPRRMLPF